MDISALLKTLDFGQIGHEMYNLLSELYPIHRSITGDGYRQTMHLIREHIPLEIHEVPSGVEVYDWTVPKEWNIQDAYVKNSRGKKIIDYKNSNLHIVGYSVPVSKKLSLEELKKHLFTLPDHPDWIPYRYSFYHENWGFCLSHRKYLALQDDEYEVYIDSSLKDGHMTFGECYIKGEENAEMLISCTACHPSLCNDNLSGVVLTTYLAKLLSQISLRYSYRFLFLPATIGAVTWLCFHEMEASRIKHGVVLVCVGDSGHSTYKRSRRGDAEIDKAFVHVLRHSGQHYEIMDFIPYGHDERQFCSPGFNLPVGCLMRTPPDRYQENHTSADNLEFVHPQFLADSISKCLLALNVIENNKKYLNLNPKCEPQLGKRGLYPMLAGQTQTNPNELALLWVLNFSDGIHSLLDIAEKSGFEFEIIRNAADALLKKSLLKEA